MGSWGVTMRQSDYGLDLLGVIVGTQLKAAGFSSFSVADALEVIKADIMEEIRRAKIMKRLLHIFLLMAVFCALLVAPAHALEYTFDGADNYLFGRPTSDDAVYQWENPNVDRSKNTALIPPGFGTPTSYLPGSGEYLTPNLVPGALSGGLVNQAGSVGSPNGGTSTSTANSGYPAASSGITVDSSGYPTVDTGVSGMSGSYMGFTGVTSNLYYSDGSLGTLKIPSIGLLSACMRGRTAPHSPRARATLRIPAFGRAMCPLPPITVV